MNKWRSWCPLPVRKETSYQDRNWVCKSWRNDTWATHAYSWATHKGLWVVHEHFNVTLLLHFHYTDVTHMWLISCNLVSKCSNGCSIYSWATHDMSYLLMSHGLLQGSVQNMYQKLQPHTHAYIHTYMHACMHTYIHMYIHTYVWINYVYVYLQTIPAQPYLKWWNTWFACIMYWTTLFALLGKELHWSFQEEAVLYVYGWGAMNMLHCWDTELWLSMPTKFVLLESLFSAAATFKKSKLPMSASTTQKVQGSPGVRRPSCVSQVFVHSTPFCLSKATYPPITKRSFLRRGGRSRMIPRLAVMALCKLFSIELHSPATFCRAELLLRLQNNALGIHEHSWDTRGLLMTTHEPWCSWLFLYPSFMNYSWIAQERSWAMGEYSGATAMTCEHTHGTSTHDGHELYSWATPGHPWATHEYPCATCKYLWDTAE